MSVKSVVGRSSSKYDLGDVVQLPAGLVGEIIGLAEYRWAWTYRIRVPGKVKTLYRDEKKLSLIKRGTSARRRQLRRVEGK